MSQMQPTGERVLVNRSQDGLSGSEKVYHTDRDCRYITDLEDYRPVERATLGVVYSECSYCAGEWVPGDMEERRCPKCGDQVANLGQHIRHCDGGGGDD